MKFCFMYFIDDKTFFIMIFNERPLTFLILVIFYEYYDHIV